MKTQFSQEIREYLSKGGTIEQVQPGPNTIDFLHNLGGGGAPFLDSQKAFEREIIRNGRLRINPTGDHQDQGDY